MGAQSTADFLSKLSVSYKEARESKYWIKLLHETDYISDEEYNSLIEDIDELINIIAKIKLTTEKNNL